MFVIGGGEIYRQTIEKADKTYITKVHKSFDADTFFPELGKEWKLTSEELHASDEKNAYDFTRQNRLTKIRHKHKLHINIPIDKGIG